MTPKEKAIELCDKYFFPHYVWENDGYQVDEKLTYEIRKRFALIAVDEIINALPPYEYGLEFVAKFQYWLDVKIEIEQL